VYYLYVRLINKKMEKLIKAIQKLEVINRSLEKRNKEFDENQKWRLLGLNKKENQILEYKIMIY
jgi:hypothetical protein